MVWLQVSALKPDEDGHMSYYSMLAVTEKVRAVESPFEFRSHH